MNPHPDHRSLPKAEFADAEALDYQRAERAIHWLLAQDEQPVSLAALADFSGLSEAYVQRLFARWVGISPKRFAQHVSQQRALAALRRGADMLAAASAAGLSGPGRLHDLVVTCEAASPGEVKSGGAGLQIVWGRAETPLGPAWLAESARGLMKLAFLHQEEGGDAELAALQAQWPAAYLRQSDALAQRRVLQLFAAYQKPEPVHLFVKGSQFQLKVWQALLALPEGHLCSYGNLASAVAVPSAARAVGSAVAANPVALLIPCHRVIRASGVVGEYRWGTALKQRLLGLELAD